jgi:WD40 repeat protein
MPQLKSDREQILLLRLLGSPLIVCLLANSGLRYTIQARFDYHSSGRSICEENTRREALATVYAWLKPNDPRLSQYPYPLYAIQSENPIFWVNGLAGSGKSTLAQTIAEWCEEDKFLGASFFCARDGDRSNVQLIFPTIAHQLGIFCPAFREELSEAVKANPDIHGSLVSRQLQKLVVEPLNAVKAKGIFPECAIIIDALDECKDDEAISVILKALSFDISRLSPLKFVITSRPIQRVTSGFRLQELIKHTQQLSLSTIPVEATKRDIALFLRNRLDFIKEHYYVSGYWPTDEEIEQLVEVASELFIFAATAVKFVSDEDVNDPERQLVLLLRSATSPTVTTARTSPYKYLDALYLQVLQTAFPTMDRSLRAHLKIILGAIALIQEQLYPGALEALLHLPSGAVRRTLRQVHSIIVIPPDDKEVIRVIHRSFADFLVDPTRCTESNFRINPSIQHTVITKHCLQTLLLLRRDICQVGDETLLNSEIPELRSRVERYIPPSLGYSCKYWSYHLCHADLDQEILEALNKFCMSHLLYWLEALSLLGSVDIAIEALQTSREALQVGNQLESSSRIITHDLADGQRLPLPPTDVPALLYDCERIVRFFYPAISASCFQTYKCVLPFSPTTSLLRTLYSSEAYGTVKLRSGIQKSWSPNTTSIEAHSLRVQSVAYSPDGQRIVSCSEDRSIKLWHARTGALLHVLEGHSARVCSVAYSPSGKEILSGSDDLTVKLWDATTGACLETWKRHTRDVRSVAWSLDGKYAASGSYDSTVVLWAVASPQDATTFTEHSREVDSIVFASDGDLLSGAHDNTCKIWSVQSKSCTHTFVHPARVMCVAASRDSRVVACGCDDSTIVLWSKIDGSQLHVLKQHKAWVWSVDFSPSDHILASGSWDHTLCLWDVANGSHLQTLVGHADQVLSVRFSPDGTHIVTGECDYSVRIWECDSMTLDRPMLRKQPGKSRSSTTIGQKRTSGAPTETHSNTGDHHAAMVRAISFSPNGKFLATAAWDDTVRLWDVQTGTRLQTLEGHMHLVSSVSWSSSGNFLTSTGLYDSSVRIWDARSGNCIDVFSEHAGPVWVSLFTRDERQVVSASDDGTIRLWSLHHAKSGTISEILFQGTGPVYTLALSSDSKWILSSSLDVSPPQPEGDIVGPSRNPTRVAGHVRGAWEETYGYPTLRLHNSSGHVLWMENHVSTVTSLAFSRDRTRALSGSQNGYFFLYDLTEILPHDHDSAAMSPVPPKAVRNVNLRTYKPVGDENAVENISFSSDERAIVSDTGYTQLDSVLWPAGGHHAIPTALSEAPTYILLDGWLWRAVPERRRICWIPPTFRHFRNGPTEWRGNMASRGHIIVFGTKFGLVVILDASGC